MKIELLLVGTKLFEKSKFFVLAKDIYTTRIELQRGRKRIIFELVDKQKKATPISHGIIAFNHLVGTNLDYKQPIDKQNFETEGYRGIVTMTMTVFDSDTFISHAEQLKLLHERLEQEVKKYTELLQNKENEWEKRFNSMQDPYEKIINKKNEKIQQLTSEQMIATLKFDEHLITLVESSIRKDMKEVLGIDKEELAEEAAKLNAE